MNEEKSYLHYKSCTQVISDLSFSICAPENKKAVAYSNSPTLLSQIEKLTLNRNSNTGSYQGRRLQTSNIEQVTKTNIFFQRSYNNIYIKKNPPAWKTTVL